MKARTREMLDEIDDAHDWAIGRTYSNGGTELHETDECRVCALRRHFTSDKQNGNDGEYRFSDGETKEDLSLRQAFARKCE